MSWARRSVSRSAASSSRPTSESLVRSPAASIRNLSPVSGVRSWCEASATKARWDSRTAPSRSAISLNARPSSTCSREPAGSARAPSSPPAIRRATPARAVIGREIDPARIQATPMPSRSASAPIPIRARMSSRIAEFTSSTLWLTRTAPFGLPPWITGTAVTSSSWSSVSEFRSPWARRPSRASVSSGRAGRSRRECRQRRRPAESASTRPARSTAAPVPPAPGRGCRPGARAGSRAAG